MMAKPWESIDAYLAALGVRIGPPRPEQTDSGGHAPDSLHYVFRARDYGDVDSDCKAIVNALLPLAKGKKYLVQELIYTPLNIFYKRGSTYDYGAKVRQQHRDHVHVGLAPNITLPVIQAATTQEVERKNVDNNEHQIVDEFRWPNGRAVVRLLWNGDIRCYGLTFRGAINQIPKEGRLNWTPGEGVVMPVNINDPEDGYEVRDVDDNMIAQFTPQWAAEHIYNR